MLTGFHWLTILGLLMAACHSTPSAVARVAPDTPRLSPMPAILSAAAVKDSSPPDPVKQPDPVTPSSRNFSVDLNDDGVPDTITLTCLPRDTSFFTDVAISIHGFARQSFHVADTAEPWTDFDDWFRDSADNVLPTRRFFLRKGQASMVLLLFGNIGDGMSRQGFTVIDIAHNRARQVMDQIAQHLDVENFYYLQDLDGDGRFELIGNHTFQFDTGRPENQSDSLGLIGPYNPYYVYTIGDTCFLNKPLMREYNQQHYVFAGYEFSNAIDVFYPNDRSQKPRLWKP